MFPTNFKTTVKWKKIKIRSYCSKWWGSWPSSCLIVFQVSCLTRAFLQNAHWSRISHMTSNRMGFFFPNHNPLPSLRLFTSTGPILFCEQPQITPGNWISCGESHGSSCGLREFLHLCWTQPELRQGNKKRHLSYVRVTLARSKYKEEPQNQELKIKRET